MRRLETTGDDGVVPDSTDRNVLTDDCRRHGALAEARNCIAWGVGSLNATLVVVGEVPGAGMPDADLDAGPR